jgi:hypothetical protein
MGVEKGKYANEEWDSSKVWEEWTVHTGELEGVKGSEQSVNRDKYRR